MTAAPALWTRYRPLALDIARDFFLPGSERQDVQQEALIGLWVATRSWDPNGAANFRTFAALVIRRRLGALVTAALRQKHQPLNESVRQVVNEEGEWLSIVDALPGGRDPVEILIDRERFDRIIAAFSSLTDIEREAVLRVAMAPHGEADVDKRTDNATQRARAKLRRAV